MRALGSRSWWGRTAAGAIAGGVLLVSFGCGSRDLTGAAAQTIAGGQAGVPVVVSCEPHQRAMVRPAVVNGTTVSQVECVAADAAAALRPDTALQPTATPVAYRTVAQAAVRDLGDTELVRTTPVTAARPVRARQVVYDERPVKRTRSVKKSAVIIGSSTGIGAGLGAAIGGKKGALIGAAIGGGGAAIWDQVTRRND